MCFLNVYANALFVPLSVKIPIFCAHHERVGKEVNLNSNKLNRNQRALTTSKRKFIYV